MRAVLVGAFAVPVVALWSLRRSLTLVRVAGGSMAPTYADGDRLLVRRTRRVRRGEAVVFRNPVAPPGGVPDPPWLVKRVAATPGDPVPEEVRPAVRAAPGATVPPGSLVVSGDARRSQDSRHFGYVPARDVVGVVLRRL
ncbi:S26 family signal peptidase [Actinomadura kijaniata]|uniref:Signal peptidase I n=1 Tax=Actinomadura namibiensis TaxID=182080 RepID=A0A7W3LR53_ACTNM|nr:S26 family signal peptidase [Actinomadura namibiensis]MBA8952821.1 signal peptidase I [Actinomadura namibiensis]